MEKEQTGGAETRVTMNNYTKEDIIRLVEEEDVEFYPSAVHGSVRQSEKYCGDSQPAGPRIEQ